MPAQRPSRRQAATARRGKRESERLFQIGAFWLGHEAGTDYIFRYWYDEEARRTRRRSTGLRDLEQAKIYLAKFVLSEPPDEPQHPDVVTFASVRRFYFQHHVLAKNNGRDVVRDKNGPRRAFGLLTVYLNKHLKESGIEGAPRVGQFTLALQHGFMRFCRDSHKLSAKTISTYLSYIKAGVRFSATPRLVRDARGREREVKLLKDAPYIVDNEAEVSKITGLQRSKRREWIPTDQQLAATLDQCFSSNPLTADKLQPLFRYAVMALCTMARPEAITELSVKDQVRFDKDVIELNQEDRLQNKKVRPKIRLVDTLRGWLLHWNLDKPIIRSGKKARPVKQISNRTIKAAARRAGVPEWNKFTKYTFRHYMGTRVRRVDGFPVERELRAAWLGHTDPDHRTTEEWYESEDPEYLLPVAGAIDALMQMLDGLMTQSLIAPGAVAGTRLVVISKPPTDDAQADAEAG